MSNFSSSRRYNASSTRRGAIHDKDGLLAVFDRFQKSRAELGAKALDQVVVEREFAELRAV